MRASTALFGVRHAFSGPRALSRTTARLIFERLRKPFFELVTSCQQLSEKYYGLSK